MKDIEKILDKLCDFKVWVFRPSDLWEDGATDGEEIHVRKIDGKYLVDPCTTDEEGMPDGTDDFAALEKIATLSPLLAKKLAEPKDEDNSS